jgi:hypothetical protein
LEYSKKTGWEIIWVGCTFYIHVRTLCKMTSVKLKYYGPLYVQGTSVSEHVTEHIGTKYIEAMQIIKSKIFMKL